MSWTFPNDWNDGEVVSGSDLNKIRGDIEHWGGDVDGGGHHLGNVIIDSALSQTPWASDINAAGFKLNNAGNIGIGTATVPIYNPVAGRRFLTVEGASDAGVVELSGNAADAIRTVGMIQFTDKNTAAADKRAALVMGVLTGAVANARGADLLFYTRPDSGGIAERMRITSQGNVGIGTAGPTAILHSVVVGGNPSLSANTAVANVRLQTSATYADIGRYNASPFAHWIQVYGGGSAFPLSLQPLGGNVGIGTANPLDKLNVVGGAIRLAGDEASNASLYYQIQRDGASGYLLLYGSQTSFSGYGFDFTDGSGVRARALTIATVNGNVGIGTTSPGQKLQVDGGRGMFNAASELYAVGLANSVGGLVTWLGCDVAGTLHVSDRFGAGRVQVEQAGNVGIGMAPVFKLDVNGTCRATAFRGDGSLLTGIASGGVTTQQVVTGSRAINGVYRNMTGKPMMVTVTSALGAGVLVDVLCDSASSPITGVAQAYNVGASVAQQSVCFWVLPTYYYTVFTTGSATVSRWSEWY